MLFCPLSFCYWPCIESLLILQSITFVFVHSLSMRSLCIRFYSFCPSISIFVGSFRLSLSVSFQHSIERILALFDSICIPPRLLAFASSLCSLSLYSPSFIVFMFVLCIHFRFLHSLSFIALSFPLFFEFYSLRSISFSAICGWFHLLPRSMIHTAFHLVDCRRAADWLISDRRLLRQTCLRQLEWWWWIWKRFWERQVRGWKHDQFTRSQTKTGCIVILDLYYQLLS